MRNDTAQRPLHFQPIAVMLVVLGGCVGTAARELLSLVVPAIHGVPVVIVAINVAGAFLLGLLLESLVRLGPDTGGRQRWRLCLGTGVLGGFTTYSTLSLDAVQLALSGNLMATMAYAFGTVVIGVVAAFLGILLASRLRGTGAQS